MQRSDDTGRTLGRRTVLAGVAGAATLGAGSRAAAAQEGGDVRPEFGGWLEGVDGGFRDARGQDSVTVLVGAQGNTGAFAFAPAGLWVDPGTTVEWRWTGEGGGHNVVAEDGPAELDSGEPVAESGVNYEYTFETGGVTTYVCEPHRSLGMKGAVAVGEDVPTVQVDTGGGTEEGPGFWARPESLVAALVYGVLGIAAGGVLAAEGYGEYRRRGGLRGPEPDTAVAAEATPEEPARELGHDEYDPVGTATLIALYFLVVLLMWGFMYFVEFLGNGPTVIG